MPLKLPVSILTSGPSKALPALPAWKAASFWAQLLLVSSVACNATGIDLFAVLGDMGLGRTSHEVIANGERAVSAVQQILPLVFGVWSWVERRSPRFRLTWFGRGK